MGIVQDSEHLCLVYEYMEHGSLRDRLDCKNNTTPLDWLTRVIVAFQSAQVLVGARCEGLGVVLCLFF
jgi:hypothetical protein